MENGGLNMDRFKTLGVGGLLAFLSAMAVAGCQTTLVETGYYIPSTGHFSGVTRQIGCRTDDDIRVEGNIKNSRLVGTHGGHGDSEFNIPIEKDGSFGPAKYFLRKHSSCDDKFYWLFGKVSKDKIVIDVEYGSPGHSGSYCGSNGNMLKARQS
jgi:hypothetical protein